MAVEKPDLPIFSCGYQGVFGVGLFGELAEHAEGEMMVFTSGPLQGLRLPL